MTQPIAEHKLPGDLKADIQNAGGHQQPKDWNSAGEHIENMSAHMKAKEADANYELHKQQATNPNLPVVDRVKSGAQAAGDAIQGGIHRVGEKLEQTGNQASNSMHGIGQDQKWVDTPMDHNLKAKAADANYELHKGQANNPLLPVGDRVQSGAQAAGDAVTGSYHRTAETVKTGGEGATGTSQLAKDVQNRAYQASEHLKVQEADANYELHKNQVTNPNLPVADRLTAGAKLVEDTVQGGVHRVAEAYYKM